MQKTWPPSKDELLKLVHADKTNKEIAEMYGVTYSAVSSRLRDLKINRQRIVRCAKCDKPFLRKRRAVYCPDCRKKATFNHRLPTDRPWTETCYYVLHRWAFVLGWPPEKIAEYMHRPVEDVKRELEKLALKRRSIP